MTKSNSWFEERMPLLLLLPCICGGLETTQAKDRTQGGPRPCKRTAWKGGPADSSRPRFYLNTQPLGRTDPYSTPPPSIPEQTESGSLNYVLYAFTIHLSRTLGRGNSRPTAAQNQVSILRAPRVFRNCPVLAFVRAMGPPKMYSTTGVVTLACKLKFCFWAWSVWFTKIKFPLMTSPYILNETEFK